MHNYSLAEKLLFPSTSLNKKKLESTLHNKIILITGASSGIGEQVALLLAEFNVHLILVARREDRLLAIKNDIEKKRATASVFPADLRNHDEMEGLLASIHQMPGGLDIVVSNAGLSINRSIQESLERYHDFTRTMAINYFAPVQMLLSVVPLLAKTKGQVINVSTINALMIPLPGWAAYQASKSAFDTWLRSAAPEFKSQGITATSIYLPLVKTPMILPTAAYQNAPAMAPAHAAEIIVKTMYTKKSGYSPWWMFFGKLASLFFRGLWETASPIIWTKKGAGK